MSRNITAKLKESPSWEIARAHLEKWIKKKEEDMAGLVDSIARARTREQMQLYARKLHALKLHQFESLRSIFDYLCTADDEQN